MAVVEPSICCRLVSPELVKRRKEKSVRSLFFPLSQFSAFGFDVSNHEWAWGEYQSKAVVAKKSIVEYEGIHCFDSDEILFLHKGDCATLLGGEGDWWYGSCARTGKKGYFPKLFVSYVIRVFLLSGSLRICVCLLYLCFC